MRLTAAPVMCLFGVLAMTASGQDKKPNFSGTWQSNSGKSEWKSGKASAVKLTIEQKGASIHVIRTVTSADGKETVTEFNCTTDGKDCDAKGAKVSLWYDGGDLIELDVGETVTKMRMSLAADGKSMNCQTDFINPQADSDKLYLDKL